MESLKNHVAVVTGASSGIGKAIAVALATEGAELYLAARRQELLKTVAKEAEARGARAHACTLDLTKDEDIHALGERLQREAGRVNILVLCGGAIAHGTLEKAPLADLDLMYRSNVRGHYALLQAMLPLLRKAPGQIVFLNSSAGLRSSAGGGQFASTQHAFRSIADSLRDEVNADGIRVLSVYPGRTATPRMEKLFGKEGRAYKPEVLMQPEDVAEMVTHSLRLPRTAEVTDISIRPMQKSY
ncbi:MAG TPA: SDR family NAD(P)-dependent oxidoreductase [Candidatus Angelobacter sp.]|nr:SDR family NAD(P)-dependent oxidoreductase [Candidatus Angelobacter sp.]